MKHGNKLEPIQMVCFDTVMFAQDHEIVIYTWDPPSLYLTYNQQILVSSSLLNKFLTCIIAKIDFLNGFDCRGAVRFIPRGPKACTVEVN